MSRRTTFWEDLGIGVLAGATLVLTSFAWVLLGSERGVMLMNRIGPSTSDLYVANPDGTGERKLFAAANLDCPRTARWARTPSPRWTETPPADSIRQDS